MRKILCLALLLFLAGCGGDEGEASFGFRSAALEGEDVILADINYSAAAPGEAAVIERSFENAPPLIPHDVADLLPITKDMNACLSCHDKALAADIGATAIPPTHYLKNGKISDTLNDSRYSCVQCHVPQSNAKILVKNTFKPVFESEALRKKSNLIDVMNEGVK